MDSDDDLYSADVPQMSPFCRLPHVVLINIAKQLSLEDFRSLRLTCRQTSSILRVLLARESFIGVPWKDNAVRLDALSRWPECAQQIRRVQIRSRAVYEDEEQMAWSETQDDPEPVLWPLKETSVTARRLAAYPEEKRIAPLKADLLCDALCRLKSLEELALTWDRFPFMSRADMGLDLELDLGDDDGDVDSELAEQLEYTTGGWQTELLVDLATDMQPLRTLTIAPLALDRMDQASYLPLISNLFNSLVRLDLQLTAHAQRSDPSLLSKLEDVLEGAWVLRELRLDFDDGGRTGTDEQRARQYRDFLPNTTITSLQSLTIVRCMTKLQDVGSLLTRHGKTLRTLELRDVYGAQPPPQKLVEGGVKMTTWQDVFHLVHKELPKLESVRLRGHFADHVREVRFKVDGEEGDEKEKEEAQKEVVEEHVGGEHGEGPNGVGSSRAPEQAPVADPAPLETYLVTGGEYPKLEWREFGV